jgi:hypothetical protein
MALTQSQRNQIASYKIQIEGYRKNLQNLKDQKKKIDLENPVKLEKKLLKKNLLNMDDG